MPYIIREDGERFIIPSYRDVLSAKKPALLRKEILLLSSNYGEYVALQRKNITQYEVAFSPDPGYLLGETVWHYFKRPNDLIYCEQIPDTFEAILVIVKGGVVYLDGTFALDAIAEELVVFRTQQNYFEVYVHGDIPISQQPEPGKFSLDETSLKSFNILPDPVFPVLPTLKIFQLQLVDAVLKSKGIGVFPLKKWLAFFVAFGLLWMAYSILTSTKKELPRVIIAASNPYAGYLNALSTPDPAQQIAWIVEKITLLLRMPGWLPLSLEYARGELTVQIKSLGVRTDTLYNWAKMNRIGIEIRTDSIYLDIDTRLTKRPPPETIHRLDEVIAYLLDSMSYVVPGNNLVVGPIINKGRYKERDVAIKFSSITLTTLDLIGQKLKDLPLVLGKVSIKINDGQISGSISLKVVGN